jgi:hypothetical protein
MRLKNAIFARKKKSLIFPIPLYFQDLQQKGQRLSEKTEAVFAQNIKRGLLLL